MNQKVVDSVNCTQYSLRSIFRLMTACCILAAMGTMATVLVILLLLLAVPALMQALCSWTLATLASLMMPRTANQP